ncbi:hypothetical protein OH768_01915 [Streptomyces sp. NBC_01622]|uniref:hypothetical protein n=1 Tax=Streptomyces sp. NBC_01622 TaxID=2975903 RepID=UPI00387061B5|nr:hypothetical protein OH768_01915 [Streptomyces sp. NBC_01622]
MHRGHRRRRCPHPDSRGRAAYGEDALSAASPGFNGKWAIHPSQIEIANRVFRATDDGIRRARRVLQAPDGAGAA